ncbi:MAG: UDP-glucose--hexose-1-phosphate uridylyltransferase [Phototrophicaceae bacterium]|jgi:UDPglucose--hexose-1-phosphate uridylyltransferase
MALEFPHRRYNPLRGEYVLVSPHRTKRPWQGQQEKPAVEGRPMHDPKCYLCAGNERANGEFNPHYEHTYVFTNDFAALLPDADQPPVPDHPLFIATPVRGTCRVICFSPRHDLTLPELAASDIRQVIDVWGEQVAELGASYPWVQVFENKGSAMGASNPHPHGQVWAQDTLPNEAAREDANQRAYYAEYGRPMLLDYAEQELARRERVVVENDEWVAVIPYWAVWPFETLLLPRQPVSHLPDLTDLQRDALADALKRLLTRYDNLFEVEFPYSMGWHGAPYNGADPSAWQLHAHFYPPLLRSATVRKFMVGYEMMAESQRDITAEQAAERLASLSDVHYKQR